MKKDIVWVIEKKIRGVSHYFHAESEEDAIQWIVDIGDAQSFASFEELQQSGEPNGIVWSEDDRGRMQAYLYENHGLERTWECRIFKSTGIFVENREEY